MVRVYQVLKMMFGKQGSGSVITVLSKLSIEVFSVKQNHFYETIILPVNIYSIVVAISEMYGAGSTPRRHQFDSRALIDYWDFY